MPRRIPANASIDTMEDEVMFTSAALSADPDAADVAPDFDAWLTELDAERARDRSDRQRDMYNTAQRVVANGRLDLACTRFGDDLLLAVGKDRKSPRWTTFFKAPVSAFVRQPLADQIKDVGGWFSSQDPALAPHRDTLTTWHAVAKQASDAEGAILTAHGERRQRREALGARLTDARDALHDQLSARARERGLDRSWADNFFLRG